jgi:hypothetical protein
MQCEHPYARGPRQLRPWLPRLLLCRTSDHRATVGQLLASIAPLSYGEYANMCMVPAFRPQLRPCS